MEATKKIQVSLLALDPYREQTIPLPTEKVLQGKDLVEWGDRNLYPEYLLELYNSVPTLRSIINGTRDFVVGDSQAIQLEGYDPNVVNHKGETISEVLDPLTLDWLRFGGLAIQVIRDLQGKPREAYFLPLRWLRMNKEANVFYYSEKWAKKGKTGALVYPAYMRISPERWAQLQPEERERHLTSVLFIKNTKDQVYPTPVYCAAVNDCETERSVSRFHLSSIKNGFNSSAIINFNNGLPDDETKAEIEREVNEKFCGEDNGSRVMLSWNPDKENATTITPLKTDNFGDRYESLSKHIRQQIFTAFRANPNLFGIPTENLGFSEEEYSQAFRLYNRTMVRPIQRKLCDAFNYIFGTPEQPEVLTITPFSLDQAGEQNVD